MKKFRIFLRELYKDYRYTGPYWRKVKKNCYWRVIGLLFDYVWSIITAPFIYPIWYIFRVKITNDLERNWFVNWIWSYGDLHDPLGWGGMPKDYRNGKNTFINRWFYSAIRNPRFTHNFEVYESETILWEKIIVDTRNWGNMITSYGVGDTPSGRIFKWMFNGKKAYFIYEDNCKDSSFWIGWVNLLDKPIGRKGRFEIAYRLHKK